MIFKKIINWLNRNSLFKIKMIICTSFTIAILLNVSISVDWSIKKIEYINGDTSLPVFIGLILLFIVCIYADFRLELVKAKERKKQIKLKSKEKIAFTELLRDSKIPDSIKKEIAKLLLSNK